MLHISRSKSMQTSLSWLSFQFQIVFVGADGSNIALVDGSYEYCHYMQVSEQKMEDL